MTDAAELYLAPTAPLVQRTGGRLDGLPSPSTWLVLFLSVITLGIYMVWWMYSRSVAINRVARTTAISAGYTVVLPALYVVNVLISALDGALGWSMSDPQGGVSILLSLYGIGVSIASIFWAFEIRKHLRRMVGDSVRIGPLMTFFFSAVYLNYKIREANEEAALAPVNENAGATPLPT